MGVGGGGQKKTTVSRGNMYYIYSSSGATSNPKIGDPQGTPTKNVEMASFDVFPSLRVIRKKEVETWRGVTC